MANDKNLEAQELIIEKDREKRKCMDFLKRTAKYGGIGAVTGFALSTIFSFLPINYEGSPQVQQYNGMLASKTQIQERVDVQKVRNPSFSPEERVQLPYETKEMKKYLDEALRNTPDPKVKNLELALQIVEEDIEELKNTSEVKGYIEDKKINDALKKSSTMATLGSILVASLVGAGRLLYSNKKMNKIQQRLNN